MKRRHAKKNKAETPKAVKQKFSGLVYIIGQNSALITYHPSPRLLWDCKPKRPLGLVV